VTVRAGKIYLVSDEGLIPMAETEYSAEDILQSLLADYPDLLAGDQMQPVDPRRWLLITREAGVPDAEAGNSRWSVDHLFVDQDAVPTLVEVKRSTDTRIRREVVGQMLDYAANVAAYWSPGAIRLVFEERCLADGRDATSELAAFLGLDVSDSQLEEALASFWERASDNLAARRLRLLFVADVIPPELQRIIEFLNESMARTEVLAVEIKQFVGAGHQTLVPRVIGRTAAADGTPTGRSRVVRRWTFDELLEAANEYKGPEAAAFLQRANEWATARGLGVTLGRGKYGPLWMRTQTASGRDVALVAINAFGDSQVSFVDVQRSAPFHEQDARLEWCRRLNEVPGVSISDDYAIRASWPTVGLAQLADVAAQEQFLEAVGWAADQIRAASQLEEESSA
jgi:hypothetical protein